MAQLNIQAALFLIAPLHINQVLECIKNVGLSQLRQFFEKYGVFRQMEKKGFFVSQNGNPLHMGYVERGVFRYSGIDTQSREHILGYAFQNE